MNAVTPPEDRVETEGGLCGSSGGRDRNVRLTLARVNKELAQGDIKALLAKGDGYFYFWSGEAADWLDRTVRVERTNDLSLEERVVRFHKLRRKKTSGFWQRGSRVGKGLDNGGVRLERRGADDPSGPHPRHLTGRQGTHAG